MPTARKTTPLADAQALPELPPELGTDWIWLATLSGVRLSGPDAWATKQYQDPAKAIAEAQRRVLSMPKPAARQPKAKAEEESTDLIDLAVAKLRQQGVKIKPHGLHWMVQQGTNAPGVRTTIEILALASADDLEIAAQIETRIQANVAAIAAMGADDPAPAPIAPRADGTLFVAIDRIAPNPWQPRLSIDDAYIAELAADILARHDSRPSTRGLLQLPAGRFVDKQGARIDLRYPHGGLVGGGGALLNAVGDLTDVMAKAGVVLQLVYGHNRLAAFAHLARTDPRYAALPIVIVTFSDEEMATAAWAENQQRRDLTVYEQARAIEAYMAAFDWTQVQAGKYLDLDRSTISNKLRLLKLPAAALDQLRSGDLSERQALALLPLSELPEALTKQHLWAGNTIGYIDGVQGLIAKAASVDSGALREAVATYVNSATIALKDKPWRNIDGPGVRSASCSDCPIRIKASDRCPDQACATIKDGAWRGQQAAAAAAVAGLPTTACGDYNDHDDLSGVNLAAIREKAKEKGCGNLAVLCSDRTYFHHKVGDFKHCGIVCGHGVGKRCACKAALARGADPAASKEAKERADRAKIRAELVAPAEAAVTAALATPTPATWRTLLNTIDSRAKLPKDADLTTIQAAIAARLVKDVVQYNLDYNPNYAGARQQLATLLSNLETPAPWAVETPEALARGRLAEALEIAGHPMAPAYLQEARVLAQQITDLATRMAVSAEIAAADDVCAQTPGDVEAAPGLAGAGGANPLLALSERLTQIEAWISRAVTAEPDLAAVVGTQETLEDIADDLDDFVDDPNIADEAFEDLVQRLGTATLALINLAKAGAAPELAEVGA